MSHNFSKLSHILTGVLVLVVVAAYPLVGKNLSIVRTVNPDNFELMDVEVEGSRMIIPGGLGGSVVYDISDPVHPVQIGYLPAPQCRFQRTYKWDISGNLAIGTGRECGMVIYDISDSQNFELLTHYAPNENQPGSAGTNDISLEDVEIRGDYAIFSAHTAGLLIYDISTPQSPNFVN